MTEIPNSDALELRDAVDALAEAWENLAGGLCRRLEGWDDDPADVQAALAAVELRTRQANVLVDHAMRRSPDRVGTPALVGGAPSREERWAMIDERRTEWRKMSWEAREDLFLEVLGDDRLTAGQIAMRLNARLDWLIEQISDEFQPIVMRHTRAVALRLIASNQLDRELVPRVGQRMAWLFSRRPGLDGPIGELEQLFEEEGDE